MTNSKLKWKADYKNGTVITEGDLNYKALDRSQVTKFSIVRVDTGETVYSINVLDGENFVYRRRTKTDGYPENTEVCHLVLRFTEQGNKFAFIFDADSKLVVKDTFDRNSRWFQSPTFASFETTT